jgi:replicative DNA helicase
MAQGSETGTYSETFGVEFQQHSLAVLARTPMAVGRYRTALDPRYFVSDTMQAVAKALLQNYDKYRANPSRATLIEATRETAADDVFPACEKLIRQMYKADVADAESVLSRMVEFGREQAVINAMMKGAELLEQKKRNMIVPEVQKALLVGEDLLDIGIDFTSGGEARVNWYAEDENLDKIPTGLPHLDYAMNGGLGRGELGVVLAPPKQGKTTTLVNFGHGALISAATEAGFNVIHYSLEIKQKPLCRRYDKRLAGKLNKLFKVDRATFIKEVEARAQRLLRGRLFVKHYTTRSCGPSNIRSHLSMMAGRGFKPDMIIVDYADIMKAERRLGDMRHEQAGIYEDLRAIAGEYNAALWTASQAPRAALEKETLDMRDFAESFEKAAVMDVGLAFCQTPDERIDGECRLFMMGLREAEDHRTVRCKIDRDRALVKSIRLLDVSMTPVDTPADDEAELAQEREEAETAKTEHAPQSVLRKIKQDAGIIQSGPKKRTPKGPTKVVPRE